MNNGIREKLSNLTQKTFFTSVLIKLHGKCCADFLLKFVVGAWLLPKRAVSVRK